MTNEYRPLPRRATRLYRDPIDKKIGGVAAGVAKYFDIDTTLVRAVWAVSILVGGFGLIARLEYGWPGWVLVKVACWLILTMAAGFAYRRPQKAGAIAALSAVAILVAVVMVYTKPF